LRGRIKEKTGASQHTFSIPDIDIPTAVSNVLNDSRGDWYQDPWGWPELDWFHRQPKLIFDRLTGKRCGWTAPIDVTKQGGGVRPAMILNPLDRAAFQALVDEISLEVTGWLPHWVCGWRLSRESPQKGKYLDNGVEWRSFRKGVVDRCNHYQ